MHPADADYNQRTDSTPPDLGLPPGQPDKLATLSQSEWEEPIYIPEAVRSLPLQNIQLSLPTRYFLGCHDFWRAGNLHGLSLMELRRLRWCDLGTLAEVLHLVHTLQQTDDRCQEKIREFREAGRRAKLPKVPFRPPPNVRPPRQHWKQPALFNVPEPIRALRFRDLPLSARLEHLLAAANLQCLGELHGWPNERLLQMRNCGKKTLAELHQRMRQAAADHQCPWPLPAAFHVPVAVRHLPLRDLPLSVRLKNVLAKLNLHCLGELHDWPQHQFRAVRNCGAMTVAELARLIERAVAGEFFPPATDPAAVPAELVRTLDTLLAQLPERNREILRWRLVGQDGRKVTLKAVGKKFGVTRERVRQIVLKGIYQLRRGGSVRLRWLLAQLAARSQAEGRPLTAERLGEWLPAAADPSSLAFYIRLIEELPCPLPDPPATG